MATLASLFPQTVLLAIMQLPVVQIPGKDQVCSKEDHLVFTVTQIVFDWHLCGFSVHTELLGEILYYYYYCIRGEHKYVIHGELFSAEHLATGALYDCCCVKFVQNSLAF